MASGRRSGKVCGERLDCVPLDSDCVGGVVRFGLRVEPPSSVYQSPTVFAALVPEVAFVHSVAFARDIV